MQGTASAASTSAAETVAPEQAAEVAPALQEPSTSQLAEVDPGLPVTAADDADAEGGTNERAGGSNKEASTSLPPDSPHAHPIDGLELRSHAPSDLAR